jgi:hypothetical protein
MSSLPLEPPTSAPELLRNLWPLLLRFGLSDDGARARLLAATPTDDLNDLVIRVSPAVFKAINAYLDDTDDAEEAVPFGDLAQAAMEAATILRERSNSQ